MAIICLHIRPHDETGNDFWAEAKPGGVTGDNEGSGREGWL